MQHIGESHPRHDALDKVTGAANYPADLFTGDMVRLKTVFARRGHAKILSIEAAAALAVPGVIAVLTSKDVPHNRYGLIDSDQPVLCDDTVRHDGDRVALVCAETDIAAAKGAELVRVEYEDLPIVTDAIMAMKPGAQRVHANLDNVLLHQKIRHGDVESAFAGADIVLEGTFTTQWQEHAYLQPDAGISYFDKQGRIVIETAGQWLHEDRKQLAEILGLQDDQVIVKYAKIGGAFGGREDMSVQCLVALATWVLKRPSAIKWNREESIIGHHKRHPFHMTAKWGAKRDGTITAVETTMIADGGAYASTSIEVLKCAMTFAHGPYEIKNVNVDGYAVYTNNVPSGAFRGFGGPQAHFAAESMITRVALALGLDPLDVRRKNLYRDGSINSSGSVMPPGVSAIPVLDRCIEEATAHLKPVLHDVHSRKRHGVGYASGAKNVGYSFGFPEQATATVELVVLDGIRAARVHIGAADVGQGAHLIMRQIAAETLSLPLDAVTIIAESTADSPNAGSASASRMTLMGGRAVKDAAELALKNLATEGVPSATVQFKPDQTTPFDENGQGTPHYCYGYVAQAVEVEVDLTTGEVTVLNVISVNDVGRAINRQQVEAQIEGCVAQAIGYALTEDFRIENGRIQTPHFSNYLLPTALDVPAKIYSIIMETPDPQGPFGARGMSEMPLVPFGAAVASAIHAATGAWCSDMPFTPERVLAAITASRTTEPEPLVAR
jgi:CO/xanthine dehydrogenase Mo-binding subunit